MKSIKICTRMHFLAFSIDIVYLYTVKLINAEAVRRALRFSNSTVCCLGNARRVRA